MILKVRVVPKAKLEKVVQSADGSYKVYVTAPAVDNKANQRLLKVLSNYLEDKSSHFRIVNGLKDRDKTVEWNNPE